MSVESGTGFATVEVQRRWRQSTVVSQGHGTCGDRTEYDMNANIALAVRQPTTDVRDALLIWVASTTVASERSRLATGLSKARSVFGLYGETTQPAVARMVQELEELKGQPDHATLIPVPHAFGATHASKLLPRGARVVGWLDAAGYRRVLDTPQPSPEWLAVQAARLR
jgi:hypothetical protein